MGDRSTLNLVGAAVTGENLGGGSGVFKDKNFVNNLRFKSLSGGTGVQIIEGSETITISAGTGGGLTTASNGLSINGTGDVVLGGTLTGDTIVDSTNLYGMVFGSTILTGNIGVNAFGSGCCVQPSGTNSIATGLRSCATGSESVAMGNGARAVGSNSIAFGNSDSTGTMSFSIGWVTCSKGFGSFSSGKGTSVSVSVTADGDASFNHSENDASQTAGHGAIANRSAILGGCNHNIEVGNTGAVILGGDTIKLTGTTYIDTTAVANLAIMTIPTNNVISDEVLVRNTSTGLVDYVSKASIGGVTPGGLNTNVQFNDGGAFGGDNTFTFNCTSNQLTTGCVNVLNDFSIGSVSFLRKGSDTTSIELGSGANTTNTNSIAIGNSATATGNSTTAIGDNAVVNQTYGNAIGACSFSTQGGDAFGTLSSASGTCSLALGRNAVAHESKSIAIGPDSFACSVDGCAIAIGFGAIADGQKTLAVGLQACACAGNATAIGNTSKATGSTSFAGGYRAYALSNKSISIGSLSRSTGSSSIAIGSSTKAFADCSIAIGDISKAEGNCAVAIGVNNCASEINTLAVGIGNIASGSTAIAIGRCNTASAFGLAIGLLSSALNASTIAIGQAKSFGNAGIAIGNAVRACDSQDITIGNSVCTDIAGGGSAIGMGNNNFSRCCSIAIGRFNRACGISNIAIGHDVIVSGDSVFGIGCGLRNPTPCSIAIGWDDGGTKNPEIFFSRINNYIKPSGAQFAIGHSNPTAKIDLSGTTACSAFRMRDGSEGATKVLTSDANGYGTWIAGGGSATASNGLSINGTGDVVLGGILTGNTEICTNDLYGLHIGHGGCATGKNSLAGGWAGNATGDNSFAWGRNATATGNCSFAMGYSTQAHGGHSFAFGETANAFVDNSIAMGGAQVTASGGSSVAMGYFIKLYGNCSAAIGRNIGIYGVNNVMVFGSGITTSDTTYENNTIINNLTVWNTPATSSCVSALVWDNADKKVKLNSSLGGGGITTANNGLTVDQEGTNVRLGGTLAQDTCVNTATFGIAMGIGSVATGCESFAFGTGTTASGDFSQAFGNGTVASSINSHAEGRNTTANGTFGSHAEGYNTTASGALSHAQGNSTIASGTYSHGEGFSTTASGIDSHAEGRNTTASGITSHAEGNTTIAGGNRSHAEGNTTKALGDESHAEGCLTTASGDNSHVEGWLTIATGLSSHAEGKNTKAYGDYSHAEGRDSWSVSRTSHAEGNNTRAYAISSHSEGLSSKAFGTGSHAEGSSTLACGYASHAEGKTTLASGACSHAEGSITKAYGNLSHSQGERTKAFGIASHSSGLGDSTHYIIASGLTSFNHSRNTDTQTTNHGAIANNSIILGGQNHNIEVGNTGAVILGGSGIKLTGSTYQYTTAVDKLAIMTTPGAGGANDVLTWESGTSGHGIIKKVTQASISDARLKTCLIKIPNVLEGISSLNAYEYEFNDLVEPKSLVGKKRYGLIAQDVEKVFPLVINNNLDFNGINYKTIEYRELVPILVEAIKELQLRIIGLENK